jgi:very-short-patch-repair endonuclease
MSEHQQVNRHNRGGQIPKDHLFEIREALGQLRKQLLDLTANNPLVSFKHSQSGRFLRLVGEAPDIITKHLFDGKSLKFQSLPDPTEEELVVWTEEGGDLQRKRPPVLKWAIKCGLPFSYDLPVAGAPKVLKLQTLHYPDSLEAKLSSLFQASRTRVEETGTNALHLVFGFLEWYEAGSSEKVHCAPLYTLPVSLDKGKIDPETSTYQYALQIRENEPQFNASIAARLSDDFGFVLPEIRSEQPPEAYLSVVEGAIAKIFPKWKVHRWGTLSELNFSRLLMYRDLDPENWPKGHELDAHPLVQAVIRRKDAGDGSVSQSWPDQSQAETSIDDIKEIYADFPIVDVADSSQHSALIEAMKGRNLVIQGPPGTGKSQTITNLIAAALYKGKSVLFVAEKLAALNVVKARMDKLGLGDFCLEIHSHNAKKIGVVASLKQRREKRFRDTHQLGDLVVRHGTLARELNAHAARVNRPWMQTGLTVLEIIVRCARYRGSVENKWLDLRVEGIDGETWRPEQHTARFTEFSAYVEQLRKIVLELGSQGIGNHPWRGIQAADLDAGCIGRTMDLIQQWAKSVDDLIKATVDFPAGINHLNPMSTVKEVGAYSDALEFMPSVTRDVDWKALGAIRAEGFKKFDLIVASADQLERECQDLGIFSLSEVAESEDLPILDQIVPGLLSTGIDPQVEIDDLKKCVTMIEEIFQIVDLWSQRLVEFKAHVGTDVPPLLDSNVISSNQLSELEEVIRLNNTLLKSDLPFRNEQILPRVFKGDAKIFKDTLCRLREGRGRLEKIFNLQYARSSLNLKRIQDGLSEPSPLKRFFSREYRDAKRVVISALQPQIVWHREMILEAIRNLESYLSAEGDFLSDQRWRSSLGSLFNGIDTDLARFERLLAWHAGLEVRFTKQDGGLFTRTSLTSTGKWLLCVDENSISALAVLGGAGLSDDLNKLKDRLNGVAKLYRQQEPPASAALFSPSDEWRCHLIYLKSILPAMFSRLLCFGSHTPETLGGLGGRLSCYLKIRKELKLISGDLVDLNSKFFGGRLPSLPSSTNALREAVANTRAWCEWLENYNVFGSFADDFIDSASEGFADELRQWGDSAAALITNYDSSWRSFADSLLLDPLEWAGGDGLRIIRRRLSEAAEGAGLLSSYLIFLRLRGLLVSYGFGEFCREAETVGIHDDPRDVFEYLVAASLADEIFDSDSELRRFDGILHAAKITEFKKCDQDLLRQTQVKAAAEISQRVPPIGNRGLRVNEHTELALIQHEAEKKKRHLPLRQLLSRAGKAAQALTPCFMMGPRSVAQYLQAGDIEFDLLVIDEASQMRPADALGAIARCKQMVVVGDSKQLAPTSFFDRSTSSDDAAEDEKRYEAAISESILDSVAPIFSRRQLLWHYRSKHPSLIAFSNKEFYDNRLMVFPSPHFSGEALGIYFRHLADGVFVDQVNPAEATAVAERVRHLLLRNPSLSIGVATMNAKQRLLIERIVETFAKKDNDFAAALELNSLNDEALFIKNLENVQGDEREVMIISCTYGRSSPGGRVMQRFGPINSAEGGRRLNVLFTRSRTRMEIFSSLQSSDVIISEKSSSGVIALRGMLRYAETGVIELATPSGREPDSDFEVAVAQLLQRRGYEVDCQIGVAGFFIDLAVKHPNKPGEYILGVECDGAAYHSSKSARDRDRIRQDVLEGMGWTISRIWSTDWFQDPERAIKPVLEVLATELSKPYENPIEPDFEMPKIPEEGPSIQDLIHGFLDGVDEVDFGANTEEYLVEEALEDQAIRIKGGGLIASAKLNVEIGDHVSILYEDFERSGFTIIHGSSSRNGERVSCDSPLADMILRGRAFDDPRFVIYGRRFRIVNIRKKDVLK